MRAYEFLAEATVMNEPFLKPPASKASKMKVKADGYNDELVAKLKASAAAPPVASLTGEQLMDYLRKLTKSNAG